MTEVWTQPVKARRVDDIWESDQAGAFEFYRDGDRYPAGIIYACPCGCGTHGSLAFRPHESPSWDWDGHSETPTLSQSVHKVGHWHHWLRNGVWESC